MRTKAFHFDLPSELIAQYPLPNRSDSRMLVFSRQSQTIKHEQFKDLLTFLKPGDLLVFNNSKVMHARLYAQKQTTGGNVELLVERCLSPVQFLAHIRASKAPKPGQILNLSDGTPIWVEGKDAGLYQCRAEKPILDILDQLGHVPLPPYIQRQDEDPDLTRYQTVYAKSAGSVAAPTAGLHFDKPMLDALSQAGIQTGFVTLHVGSGTFQPVRTEWIHEHRIHCEWLSVDEALCQQVKATKASGGRVIAVGTTALRALETASQSGVLTPFSGDTTIFIYPGYVFKTVQGLLTNFHLPESTLLMLVAAFIGFDETMAMYQEAVKERYRFFSYGDVTLLL
ncbi:MAG: tRNA preQ1(34) S-adenosylmethionine ribosyltransferase-isomerase QueA [Gammaproteobacteria bacterium]|nr:tRNA preQ1(34) S-adenosylmethionine ribosyltransferase-isomerase QueA [Gammaproteobacteria bacterium]